MTRLARPAVLLLVSLCLSSVEGNASDIVEVYYSQKTITAASGSSVKLSCEARYDFEQCGLLHVAWNQQDTELTDPRKYLTTVNETVMAGGMRRRQVVTEILDLTPEDTAGYQCSADCEKKDSAVGHFININVRG